jgi:PhoPQ-activated pathogenicity-related protein
MKQLNGKTIRFKHVEGRIILVVSHLVWGEYITLIEEDVTDEIMPIVDDCLDYHLNLKDYKHSNARIERA